MTPQDFFIVVGLLLLLSARKSIIACITAWSSYLLFRWVELPKMKVKHAAEMAVIAREIEQLDAEIALMEETAKAEERLFAAYGLREGRHDQ